MKILTLLRHADASPAAARQDDCDRPLSARGAAACQALAARLATPRTRFDRVLCSTAVRAQQTLERLRPALAVGRVEYAAELYLASDDALLERLGEVEGEIERALVVAHNPGLQLLLARLAGSGDADALQRASAGFPPAALAELHFETPHWHALRARTGRLVRFVTQRSLQG